MAREQSNLGIKEIAREAGVSVASVSRVINGYPFVSETMRQRVLDTVARLGYRPNVVARSLRTRSTATLGAVIPNIGNAHFSDAVRAMQDAASAAGYTVLVVNTDGRLEQEDAALHAMLGRQVDGIVLVSASMAMTPAVEAVLDGGLPLVAMDRAIRGLRAPQVVVDTRGGTRAAVLHLAEQGRRRIAFIGGPRALWTASEKLRGYRDGLRAAGLEAAPELVLPGDYTRAGGEAQAEALLALDPQPDAVVIANNLMTLGAMHVFLSQELAIPAELAVVGYDDAEWTSVVRPTLSVVAQPTYELGRRAVTELLALIDAAEGDGERGAPRGRIRLDSSLVVRESSAVSAPAGTAAAAPPARP